MIIVPPTSTFLIYHGCQVQMRHQSRLSLVHEAATAALVKVKALIPIDLQLLLP